MFRNLTFLIARRYLLSVKSHSVVNIISIVSLVSLLIPVAAVIVLLSVFNGFGAMVSEVDSAVEGDLTISLREGRLFEEGDLDSVAMCRVRGVEALSYLTEQMMLVEYRGRSRLLTLRGIDDNYTSVMPIEAMVTAGRFETQLGDMERVVLGNSVASDLGIRNLFDIDMSLYSLKSGRMQSLLPIGGEVHRRVSLSGVLLLDQESEQRYGYVSRRLINDMLGREGVLSRVVVRVDEQTDIARVKRALERVVDERFKVESREELSPALYEILRAEKMGVLLICSLVMLLATFSLVGALAMLIIEKRDDVERLRAMGMTRRDIHRIFIFEGRLISCVAVVLGVLLGVVVTLLQQHFGFVQMPMDSMLGAIYPVDLQLLDVALVVVISVVISSVLSQVVVRRMVWL